MNYFLAPGKVRWFEMFEFKVLLKNLNDKTPNPFIYVSSRNPYLA